jgi:hypothetical protein
MEEVTVSARYRCLTLPDTATAGTQRANLLLSSSQGRF